MTITEGEKLDLNITATIQFSFGTICDRVQSLLENNEDLACIIAECAFPGDASYQDIFAKRVQKVLDERATNNIRIIQREVRNQGNSAIRIIENHLDHYRILRRHNKDKINVERVTEQHRKRAKSGDPEVQREAEDGRIRGHDDRDSATDNEGNVGDNEAPTGVSKDGKRESIPR